jgi:hypothetical protein
MIDFNTAIKNNNSYISTPKQSFILNLTNIDIINNNNNNNFNNDKFILNLKINDSNDKLKLYNIEEDIKNTVINNNSKWFSNNMSQDKIIDKYIPSFDSQNNILDIIVSNSYDIKIDGFKDNNIKNIIKNINKYNHIKNVSIKMIGIYIKKDIFYIRWLLESIEYIPYIGNFIEDNDIDLKYQELLDICNKKINNINLIKKNIETFYKKKDFENLSKSFYLIRDKT